ncbi:MAG: YraN family protein [Clostridia bacterium]|nr:YraN family protein [Clostridia bacterium]
MRDFKKVQNKIKGDKGEILVQNFLKAKKYQILETNYKNRLGEIDIIAKHENVIVFVEVKARINTDFGRPIEAVNQFKQNKIRKVAELYLQSKNQYYADVRFDVVEVLDGEITHIENAF